jgi:hypothetical protein
MTEILVIAIVLGAVALLGSLTLPPRHQSIRMIVLAYVISVGFVAFAMYTLNG